MFAMMVPMTAHPARNETMKRPTQTYLIFPFVALAALSLLPQAALAQAPIVRIDAFDVTPKNDFKPDSTRFGTPPFQVDNSTIAHVLNIADCKAISAVQNGARVRFTWTWGNKPLINLSPTYTVKLAPPDVSCDPNSQIEPVGSTCDVLWSQHTFTNPLTASGEILDVDFKVLLGGYATDPAGRNCDANVDTTSKLFFVVPGATSTLNPTATYVGAIMNIEIDLQAPVTPTMAAPAPGNSNLHVSWTQADTSSDPNLAARVYWSDQAFTAAEATSQTNHSDAMTGTSYQITGLTNGTKYWVSVTAIDGHGNESGGSTPQTGLPVITYDLWTKYQEDGGQEQGGFSPCNAQPRGNAGPLALLGMLGALVLLLARRRVRVSQLLLALLVIAPLSVPSTARAESPQTMSAELRVGSYKPGIDNAFPSNTPYASVMKDGSLGYALNLDWRIWHEFGELGAGFGLGRWSHDGVALLGDGSASNDTTTMTVIPLTLSAVYRFDIFAKRYDFPVIPYARVGGVYAIWWMLDGVGNVSSYTNKTTGKSVRALGGTGGLEGSLGLRVLLDVFEPASARSFDIEMGVNHSYVFVEAQKLWLNDFGSSKSINLSDTVIAFGLAFDL